MKNINKLMTLALSCLMLLGVFACGEDDLSTNQYQQGVHLNVFGPSPVMRGGTLRFLGSNLDQVKEVIIPGVDPITDIDVRQAGVPSEILVQVPKDGPEEGYVKLITAEGKEITTQTKLTYTEPIEFTSFSPASAMPGDVITIKGDYLNLMHEVIFADEVVVPETAFLSHTRYEIKVAVPEEARTGEIILSDGQEDLPNWIYSETELTVGTAAAEGFSAARLKAGETLTITGTDLNLVASVKFNGAEVFAPAQAEEGAPTFTVSEDGKTLTLVIPAEAASGDVVLVMRSGVEVPVAMEEDFQVVVPTDLAAAPAPVKAGAALTISGKDLDLVTGVVFPMDEALAEDAEEVAFTAEATKLVIAAVPDIAQEGDITLNMANGMSVTVPYTLVKPVITEYNPSPVAAGGVLTITGTDLDLIVSISFGDQVVTAEEFASADDKNIVLTVPSTADSCEPVLTLKNAATETASSLEITKPEACYITEVVTEEENRKGGELFVVKVANEGKLTGVQVNGADVQYILNGQTLYINMPSNAGAGTVIKLVSSNGEVENVFDFQSALIIETVLWSGLQDLGNWSINYEVTPQDMFVTSGAEVGDKVRIYGTPTADWWQVQLFDGHWGGLTELGATYGNGNNVNSDIEPLENGYIEFTITADMWTAFTTYIDWGYAFIIQGESFIINKITLYQDHSKVTLWEGEQDLGSWSVNWEVKPADMFVAAGVKAGQKFRIYGYNTADWWQVQLFDGHWNGLTSLGDTFGNGNNVNSDICDLSAGYIEINVTAEMAELFTTCTDWGYAFIIQGESFVVTKLELAN